MDYTSANVSLWSGVLNCGLIAALVLLANLLRRKVKPIRNALIPTSVLAGFIGILVRELGIVNLDTDFLDMLTYHALAIGFIALSLRAPRASETEGAKADGLYHGVNSGMFIVSNYLLQGVIGLALTIGAALTIMPDFFEASGILLPMGFGQGPGQANNIGLMYESLGFAKGQNFGLAIASIGFIYASVGGILFLYYLKKKGKMPREATVTADDNATELLEEADEVPLTEPIDRLTLQLALIFLTYALTYAFSYGFLWIFRTVPALQGVHATISPLIWGFNFLIGSSMALVLRNILGKFRQRGLMTRQYRNNYLLNRISGFAFDIMIVGAISTVSIGDLSGMWGIFLLITFLGGVVTFFYNLRMAKVLYPDFPVSGFMAMYGMMTGTASTGVMLLRETDPLFRTRMSANLVTGSSTAIIFAIPILIFVGLAPQSQQMAIFTLLACLLYFLLLQVLMIRRTKKYRQTHRTEGAEDETL